MSNYAALIDVLSVAGSRLSDGTANASGVVYFFQPGTNTPVNAYSDAAATTIITQPVVLTSGGLVNTSTFPNGIFVTQPVRLLVQDVSGNSVVDTTYIPATAGDTGLSNAGWTDSTVDGAFTKLYTSTGGQDGKYLESLGATQRTIKAKFQEISVSVKDFGAVGDGVATDTTAIQNAANEVGALGGGILYFPPGTYKTDQAITFTSINGLTVLGAGFGSTNVSCTHATANGMTFSSCNGLRIIGINFKHASSTTGAAISVTNTAIGIIDQVTNDIDKFQTGLAVLAGASGSQMVVSNCGFFGNGGSGIGINITARSTTVRGGAAGSKTGYAIQLGGACTGTIIDGVNFASSVAPTAIRFDSALTGTGIIISNCTGLGSVTTPLSIATATLPVYRQWGNGIDAVAFSAAIGNTLTPTLYQGNEIILSATSGGAGTQTVAAPAILPGTSALDVNLYWDFVFINASGGAVTWATNAIYVLNGATAVPATAAHTIQVRFRWDRATSKFRECSRGDTVT